MPSKPTVALAEPADIEQIVAVEEQVWLATYPDPELGITAADIQAKFHDRAKRQAQFQKWYFNRPDHKLWVAKDGDQVVGIAVASKSGGKHQLKKLYLLPAYQGQGVGRDLMEVRLAWLGANQPIYLKVAANNLKAQAFDRRFGFRKLGPAPRGIVLPGGKIIPTIIMVRQPANGEPA